MNSHEKFPRTPYIGPAMIIDTNIIIFNFWKPNLNEFNFNFFPPPRIYLEHLRLVTVFNQLWDYYYYFYFIVYSVWYHHRHHGWWSWSQPIIHLHNTYSYMTHSFAHPTQINHTPDKKKYYEIRFIGYGLYSVSKQHICFAVILIWFERVVWDSNIVSRYDYYYSNACLCVYVCVWEQVGVRLLHLCCCCFWFMYHRKSIPCRSSFRIIWIW